MLKILILLAVNLCITGCINKKLPDSIPVEGFVKNLPNGKVYLIDAYNWKVVLDSAIATDGHFKFHVKSDSSFSPFLAGIYYPDSSFKEYHQIRQLVYLNSYKPKGKGIIGTAGFFVGPEGAIIEGEIDLNHNVLPKVSAGKDNELYQRLLGKQFGYIKNIDSIERVNRIRYFKSYIAKNPSSYFLFREILYNKEDYTEMELEELMHLFDKDIQKSILGRYLRVYLTNRTDLNTPYSNLVLLDAKHTKHEIINLKAKLNMLIFWASWCGPCRQEIPYLKKVYKNFKDKGLHMASISIDEDQGNWQRALLEENTDWQQLVVQKDHIMSVKQQFNFNSIPLIILTDSSGKKLLEINGYGDSARNNIDRFIAKQL